LFYTPKTIKSTLSRFECRTAAIRRLPLLGLHWSNDPGIADVVVIPLGRKDLRRKDIRASTPPLMNRSDDLIRMA
jgi:hypothetical protein